MVSKNQPTLDEIMGEAQPIERGKPADDIAPPDLPGPDVIDPKPEPKAIAKTERAPTELDGGKIQLRDASQVAQLAAFVQNSGMKIGGANNAADITLALMAGLEAGLSATQTIKNIMVVNGRPTIWGDALLALVQQSDEYAGCVTEIQGEGDDREAVCTMHRLKRLWDGTGAKITTVARFGVSDAKAAGLWSKSIWKSYPERMLCNRARTFAIRDAFSDMIGGLNVREEVEDYQPASKPATVRAGLAEILGGDE